MCQSLSYPGAVISLMSDNHRANKFAAPCKIDGKLVDAGQGVVRQYDGKWHVYHRQCAHQAPEPPPHPRTPSTTHDGWHKRPMLSIDTETTGPDTTTARIISVGIVFPDRSEREWLVKTVDSIPPAATEIHHITDDQLATSGVDPVGAFRDIGAILAGAIADHTFVVAFNVSYDLTLLHREFNRYNITQPDWSQLRVIDPWVLHYVADRTKQSRRLVDLAKKFKIIHDDAHTAVADARAARDLAYEIACCEPELASKSPFYITAEQRSHRHRYEERRAKERGKTYVRGTTGWPIEDIPDKTRAVTPPRTGNTGKRWSDEECEQLRVAIAQGLDWATIAERHSRPIGGVWSQAQKRGYVPFDQEPPFERPA